METRRLQRKWLANINKMDANVPNICSSAQTRIIENRDTVNISIKIAKMPKQKALICEGYNKYCSYLIIKVLSLPKKHFSYYLYGNYPLLTTAGEFQNIIF
jgi:hypothetical protein